MPSVVEYEFAAHLSLANFELTMDNRLADEVGEFIAGLPITPPASFAARIEFVDGDLSASPQRVSTALERDMAGLHSARRGPYRILYSIDEEHHSISILRDDHRSDVYRPR
ncbi:type II toxin-antitoxin system RelE/ParE family toxin [Arthrobacter sp. 2RAF6]|uniref:type II toxin-antitoxin system RelE family toxin n=1 Tax=Arthrobacter sp. 2RAF6 TaxID=3233002 RepID=UPI003F92E3C6